jgi:hypothetical protein
LPESAVACVPYTSKGESGDIFSADYYSFTIIVFLILVFDFEQNKKTGCYIDEHNIKDINKK